MRHKSFLRSAIIASAGSLILLSGCSQDPILPDKAEEYSRDFIKKFGVFDLNHDWNTATKTSVNVVTTSPTEVKVYADVQGTRYLFATYTNVEGQRTLDVDVPKGTTDLIVKANGHKYSVKAGGSVDLDKAPSKSISRNINEGTRTTGDIVLTYGKTENYKYFPPLAVADFINLLPEEQSNMAKVIPNFSFTSYADQEFTLYPIFWNTSSTHVLGIYWTDENGIFNWADIDDDPMENRPDYRGSFEQMQDLYWTKSGELEYCEEKSNDDFMTNGTFDSKAFNLYYSNEDRFFTPTDNDLSVSPTVESGAIRTKGITIRFNKDGVRFGFYLKVDKSNKPLVGEDYPTDDNGNVLYVKNGSEGNFHHIVFSNARQNKSYGDILSLKPYLYYDKEWYWRLASTEDKIPYSDDYIINQWAGPSNTIGIPNYNGQTANDYTEWQLNFNIGYNNVKWDDNHIKEVPINSENIDEAKELLGYVQASFLEIKDEDSYDGKTRRYFAFEDWKLNTPDLNDLIFVIESSKVKVTDETTDEEIIIEEEDSDPEPEPDTPFEWIIACEDLGSNDFDFNDVVFSLSNFTDNGDGTATIDITPLAAGGTLPVYIYYGGITDAYKIIPDWARSTGGEFHSWFEGNHSSATVINAKSYSAPPKGSYTLTVKDDFSISCKTMATGEGDTGNMGGFRVEVAHASGSTIISATNPNFASSIGNAPQMICVPGTWKWPVEENRITNVYEDFTNWCANQSDDTNHWHENRGASGYWNR